MQNILASVKTASLIEQISGQDYREMTRKCILNKRIDLYTDAWSKYSKANEGPSEEEADTSVGAALKNLSMSVTSLKKSSINGKPSEFLHNLPQGRDKAINLLGIKSESRQQASNH